MLGILDDSDTTIGTADFPPVWNQRVRRGLNLHWGGNNDRLEERNLSAALAAGAKEDSVDLDSLERVAEWLLALPAPRYPASRIDRALAARGRAPYERSCASGHSFDGERIGLFPDERPVVFTRSARRSSST